MSAILWPVDAVTGAPSYTGRWLRQTTAVGLAGATPTRPFGGISGIRPGAGAPVSVTSTVWTVGIHSGILDLETSGLAGPYAYTFDVAQTGAMTAAPSSPNNRIDILSIRLDDPAEGDGSSTPKPVVVYTVGVGTSPTAVQPATPARSMLVATISVPFSGAPAVSWVSPFTVAAGGILPVATAAVRTGLTAYEGMPVYQMDTNTLQIYNGATWDTYTPSTHTQQIQSNTTTLTTNGAGNGTITYPTAFTSGTGTGSVPVPVCTAASGGGGFGFVRLGTLSNTGFTFTAISATGSAMLSSSVTVAWIAAGVY